MYTVATVVYDERWRFMRLPSRGASMARSSSPVGAEGVRMPDMADRRVADPSPLSLLFLLESGDSRGRGGRGGGASRSDHVCAGGLCLQNHHGGNRRESKSDAIFIRLIWATTMRCDVIAGAVRFPTWHGGHLSRVPPLSLDIPNGCSHVDLLAQSVDICALVCSAAMGSLVWIAGPSLDQCSRRDRGLDDSGRLGESGRIRHWAVAV